MVNHNLTIDDNSIIDLTTDNNSYNLDIGVSIIPGPQPKGVDYNNLKNKPSINGVTIQGDKLASTYNVASIYYHTTSEWDSQISLISQVGVLYVYTDYQTKIENNETHYIPGIKLGDGITIVKDLPFSSGSGAGVIPSGGLTDDLLAKRASGDYELYWVTPASSAEQDNTRPITAAAVYTEIGNINALLATI